MLKDTKSLGNNKAPACESQGFVHKKKKVRILTPSCIYKVDELLFYRRGSITCVSPSMISCVMLYAGLAYSKLSNPVLLIIRSYPLF